MNILCYSSCYGNIFKEMISYKEKPFNFDIILWYELKSELDYKKYCDYDIILCEYVSPKFDFRSSDIFLNNIRKYNTNAIYIVYPLIVMYIFPFHNHHFGFMPNNAIDSLLKEGKSYNEICTLYEKNEIQFNPKMNFTISLNRLKETEKYCNIIISDYIENNIQKELLFIDTLFPSQQLFNIILSRILNKINNITLQIKQFNFNITPEYLFHINNSYYTDEMIKDLELEYIQKETYNSNTFYYNKLKAYLVSKNKNDL